VQLDVSAEDQAEVMKLAGLGCGRVLRVVVEADERLA
jgi:hypothetical protein